MPDHPTPVYHPSLRLVPALLVSLAMWWAILRVVWSVVA